MKQTGRPRGQSRTLDPKDVPLNWLWYRRERVREAILEHYSDPDEVGRALTRHRRDDLRRRWWVINNGFDNYNGTRVDVNWSSLLAVDKIFCALDLHIWILGDPDAVSPMAPGDEPATCPRGHEYTPENTRWEHRFKQRNSGRKSWTRRCRECDAERYQEEKARHAAA